MKNNKIFTVFMAHMFGFIGMMFVLLFSTSKNFTIFLIGFLMIFANRWIVLYRYLNDKEVEQK